jgi:hypothetical protein
MPLNSSKLRPKSRFVDSAINGKNQIISQSKHTTSFAIEGGFTGLSKYAAIRRERNPIFQISCLPNIMSPADSEQASIAEFGKSLLESAH